MNPREYCRLRFDIVESGECAYDYIKMVLKRGMPDADVESLFVQFEIEWNSYCDRRSTAYMRAWLAHRASYASFQDALAEWQPAKRREPSHRRAPQAKVRKRPGMRMIFA